MSGKSKQYITRSISRPSIFFVGIIIIGLAFSSFMIVNGDTFGVSNNVYAQGQVDKQQKEEQSDDSSQSLSSTSSKDRVILHLNSVEFVPLTNSENNQLKILVDYRTNDISLINSPMAGTMKVYGSDGTLIKTSKIPNGFVLGQLGPMQFATSFADKTITDVKADVYMTDTLGNKISNTLTTEASLTI